MEANPQLELANNLLKYTDTDLFLTGRAGTGKTTFLHHLRNNSPKRMIVVAPTGVAAINAKGVTIHSFFQLGLAPFVPGTRPTSEFFRFSKEKINIIRSLDLLVIDEISMVRADLLDAVDNTLRYIRRNDQPFGDVQLLMIGDLEQLSPIVQDEEWDLLCHHYKTPFFFDSQALKKTSYACIELKTVYRQSDEAFLNILNRIREKNIDDSLLRELNKRHQPSFHPENEEGYIILTTHNSQAQSMNREQLAKINEKNYFYDARVTGDFPERNFPTDAKLELKKGAQIMFVKNDPSSEKRYYNGKIAVITHIEENCIEAQGKEDEHPITVERVTWSKMKYIIDPETKELKEEEEGSFEQYPLKAAWAITIHKSQGLTFDKVIIDAHSSFAHGQVYVALSRCRTLEGLVLSSPITDQSIIRSDDIDAFTRSIQEKEPDKQQIQSLRKEYFVKMLLEQFSYNAVQSRFNTIHRLLNKHFQNLYPELMNHYQQAEERFQNEILNVSKQVQSRLQQLLSEVEDPEKDPFLQEWIESAASYLHEKNPILQDILDKTIIETDNQEIQKKVNNALISFQTEIRQKQKTLEACLDGFSVPVYLNSKSKAVIEDESQKRKKKERTSKEEASDILEKDILHPELYEQLRSWRAKLAQEQEVPVYVILSQMALIGIANFLPQDSKQLLQISGVGKVTLSRYGEAILQIVQQNIHQHGYEVKEFTVTRESKIREKSKPDTQEPKISTKVKTFLLYQQGKSIEEIAKERSLAVSTIEGHLVPYLENGDISLENLVAPEKSEIIKRVLQQNVGATLTEIKANLEDDYSYGEIRFVRAAYGLEINQDKKPDEKAHS
ncbi:MAG: helix-turn-helix domain-containing protein [Methanomicrobiales archaeon]|nr:helix-turn-helix domain-containing protein [Methanomicrobiales archaeon]